MSRLLLIRLGKRLSIVCRCVICDKILYGFGDTLRHGSVSLAADHTKCVNRCLYMLNYEYLASILCNAFKNNCVDTTYYLLKYKIEEYFDPVDSNDTHLFALIQSFPESNIIPTVMYYVIRYTLLLPSGYEDKLYEFLCGCIRKKMSVGGFSKIMSRVKISREMYTNVSYIIDSTKRSLNKKDSLELLEAKLKLLKP